MVNSKSTVSDGRVVVGTKRAEKLTELMSNSVEAAAAVRGTPPTSAVRVDVLSGKVPTAAPAGIWTVTVRVQVSSGCKLPPVNVRVLVPDRVEPAPQPSLWGNPVATKPANPLLRSWVKLMLVAAADGTASSLPEWSGV